MYNPKESMLTHHVENGEFDPTQRQAIINRISTDTLTIGLAVALRGEPYKNDTDYQYLELPMLDCQLLALTQDAYGKVQPFLYDHPDHTIITARIIENGDEGFFVDRRRDISGRTTIYVGNASTLQQIEYSGTDIEAISSKELRSIHVLTTTIAKSF